MHKFLSDGEGSATLTYSQTANHTYTFFGSTRTISDNIYQMFTAYAVIIALLILGSVLWGLLDNQRVTRLG